MRNMMKTQKNVTICPPVELPWDNAQENRPEAGTFPATQRAPSATQVSTSSFCTGGDRRKLIPL